MSVIITTDKDGHDVRLRHAPKIDLDLFTDQRLLHLFVKNHLIEYRKDTKKPINSFLFYSCFKLMCENLIMSPIGISVPLFKDYYSKMPKRYNCLKITAYQLRSVINYLVSKDLIVFYKGVKFNNQSYYSRVIPSQDFKFDLRNLGLDKMRITKNRDMERIVLKANKDKGKKKVDYKDNRQTRSKRDFILKYEEHINKYEFKINHKRIGRIIFKRVFNNESFFSGGRFYSSYQNIPSSSRSQDMRVNNLKMREWDYAGLHINMLYALEDLPIYNGHVYTIKGFEKFRNLFKIALQIAINAKDKRAAYSGMNKHLRSNGISSDVMTGKKLLELFANKHIKISHYFFSGVGVKLQYKDSQIVEKILNMAIKKNIPVLPVHDSFLAPEIYSKEIIRFMKKSALKVMNTEFNIDKK